MPDSVKHVLEVYEVWNRSRWCCRCFCMMTRLLKICSTVLRPDLKPACSSASSSSAVALSRLRTTQSMVLLGCLIRLMVRQFRHCLILLLCGKCRKSNCVHSFGHSCNSHTFWHIAVRTVVVASPPFLSSSEGMLSTPGDFFCFQTAHSHFHFFSEHR